MTDEMSDKEKLFIIMAHADELQKIANASQKELQAAVAAIKEMAKGLPAEVSGTVSGTVSGLIKSHLAGPVEQAGTELGQVVGAIKAATKGLWLYPAVIVVAIMVVLSGYAYVGLKWVQNERDQVKAELAALNHELAKTANVTTIGDEDGYWVEIDKSRKIIDATNGKIYAKMPRR